LKERASWCVDKPCRLVQYDDDTIFEACKKYLGWEPTTSTVNVPGYTVTVTSYPTDCKKDDGYKSEPVPAYPTDKDEDYKPEPYPTTSEYASYPTETPEYEPEPYPTTSEYPEYPTETPEYAPEPYPTAPAPYPEDEPSYNDGSDDGQYNDGTAPSYNDNTDDYEHSDDKQPWENDFDTNYSGPDGPLPWDDVDQTSELADAIDAGGYDSATQELGLDDAPWNALPADYPQKRDYPTEQSYDSSYGEDGVDYEEPSYDGSSYDDGSEGDYGVNTAPEDSYKPTEGNEEDIYPEEYAPNIYGPDVPESGSYESSGNYEPSPATYPEDDSSYDGSYDEDYSKWVLPDSSEY
jgi:hypothetical protein